LALIPLGTTLTLLRVVRPVATCKNAHNQVSTSSLFQHTFSPHLPLLLGRRLSRRLGRRLGRLALLGRGWQHLQKSKNKQKSQVPHTPSYLLLCKRRQHVLALRALFVLGLLGLLGLLLLEQLHHILHLGTDLDHGLKERGNEGVRGQVSRKLDNNFINK